MEDAGWLTVHGYRIGVAWKFKGPMPITGL
jgi:hypothetical protein